MIDLKYIIMADGKGIRWNNYQNIPKHFVKVDGEILIERTVRQLKELAPDAEIIITSHDKRYEIEGSRRYEPKSNFMEIDRFTFELIEDDICFLYGDTYYSDKAMKLITSSKTNDLLFFGNNKSIVAILVKDGGLFKKHILNVKDLYLKKKILNCKGWQVYQSFMNLEYDVKQIKEKYVIINDGTTDYNTPEEYEKRKKDV